MFACVQEKNILIPDLCIYRPVDDCVVSNAPLQIIFQLISIDEKWKLYPFALYSILQTNNISKRVACCDRSR